MDLPEPNLIRPTAENVAFARSVARAQVGMPLPGEIPAGRELDALIAEKVMGWRNWTGSDHSGLIGGTWSPSTDINAAWQVVEHLAQMDPPRWLEVGRREHGWTVNVWVHCQAHGDRCEALDRPVWIDDQETAPLVICRAALAAVSHG